MHVLFVYASVKLLAIQTLFIMGSTSSNCAELAQPSREYEYSEFHWITLYIFFDIIVLCLHTGYHPDCGDWVFQIQQHNNKNTTTIERIKQCQCDSLVFIVPGPCPCKSLRKNLELLLDIPIAMKWQWVSEWMTLSRWLVAQLDKIQGVFF